MLELAGASLRSVLSDRARHPDISWALRVRWLCQICEGLQRLHSLLPRPLIHRDLKAGNVLLSCADLSVAVAKVRVPRSGLSMQRTEVVSTRRRGVMLGLWHPVRHD